MKRILQILLVVIILLSCLSTVTMAQTSNSADLANISYAYDLSGKPYVIPSPYVYDRSVEAGKLGISAFKDLSDIFYDSVSNLIVLTDSGNNRIVILDEKYKVVYEITTFKLNGKHTTFTEPKSAVIKNGILYVADSANARIVCFDTEKFKAIYSLEKPEVSALGSDYIYIPEKIAVDDSGHIYVIAKNVTDGIMLLDSSGKFLSFFGAPKVEVSPLENLSKRFMTKEQRSKLYKSIPTEYSAIMVDSTGFIGLTTQSSTADPISRMNHGGTNIFSSKQNVPKGDEVYSLIASSFVDLAEDDAGNYLALDNRRGRIFIYTKDGDFLGCFGGSGVQKGTFYSAVSIAVINGEVAVVDISRNTIDIFQATEFGKNVFSGLDKINSGDYVGAKPYFKKVISMCSSYIPAHHNLGRISFWEGDYEAAAKKFKYVDDSEYYSLAYKQLRTDFINDNFIWIIAVVMLLILALIVLAVLKKRSITSKSLLKGYTESFSGAKDKWKYVNYCCFHPFDGFWCVRRENKGSMAVANTLLGMFIVFSVIRVQFSGYLFSSVKGDNDAIVQTLTMLIPILLWIIVNWSIAIFFDGKARMKDMYITTCYALKPYIISSLILFPLTYFLVADEAFVYTILNSLVWIWCLLLMFLGMISVQDFSLGKAVVATIFTILGIALIVFISLVLVNMSQDIINYFKELIVEIRYRFM